MWTGNSITLRIETEFGDPDELQALTLDREVRLLLKYPQPSGNLLFQRFETADETVQEI